MPEELIAQVRFIATTGKTEDDITNTWAFRVETSPPPAATLTAITQALDDFYTALASNQVNDWGTTVGVKYYNRADPPKRQPILSTTFLNGSYGTGGLGIPREVSGVLSYHGALVSGSPAARRRGRVYLPTPTNGNLDNAGRLASSWVTIVKNAANALLTASDGHADWTWVVWSRTNGNSVPVIGGHVDNAPDIQRRRGLDATSRLTFP